MFIGVLFIIENNEIKWHIQTVEYYAAIKNNISKRF